MKLITKIFIAIDFLVLVCFFLVYGPIKQIRVFWITTAMETGSHKYLAHIFYSDKAIEKVLNENYFVALSGVTDPSEVTINQVEKKTNYESVYEQQILEREDDALYKLIEFKYGEFDCYLVAIYDPTRVMAVAASNLPYGKVLTDIARENDAIVAINGGGYNWSNNMPSGFIVSNGETKYFEDYRYHVSAAINEDGVLIAGDMIIGDIESKKIKNALSFQPALIINGEPIKIVGTGGSGMNPRTVIAQRKDGIILFLVVNGYGQSLSWKGRGGVYLNDLLVILQRYGAYNAVNMDGGSSTTMVIEGKLINSPCEPQQDGKDFIKIAWILK